MRKLLTLSLVLLLLVSLAAPVSASSTPYILDEASLLTQQQRQSLNAYAQEITETYGIGIYVLTVWDYRAYGNDVFDTLWEYYHDHGLGYGENREGMILMLSMAERDYATFFYGDNTEYAFNIYGQVLLEEQFLDNFSNNDWYGGFYDYLSVSEEYMALAAAGTPVRDNPWSTAVIFIGIACLISLILTLIQWAKMKNVSKRAGASRYITAQGLVLSQKTDRFLYRNVKRVKIETKTTSGSSSVARSGGGGSGRSGKF